MQNTPIKFSTNRCTATNLIQAPMVTAVASSWSGVGAEVFDPLSVMCSCLQSSTGGRSDKWLGDVLVRYSVSSFSSVSEPSENNSSRVSLVSARSSESSTWVVQNICVNSVWSVCYICCRVQHWVLHLLLSTTYGTECCIFYKVLHFPQSATSTKKSWH